MSKELWIAFCFSVAAHAAVVGICPAPQARNTGQNGEKQEIVVLGVVELSSPVVPEISAPDPLPKEAETVLEEVVKLETAVEIDPVPPDEELALLPQNSKKEERPNPLEQFHAPMTKVPTVEKEDDSGKPQLTQGRLDDIRSQYLRKVMRQLEKAKQYPPLAYRHGLEGTVEVAFTISRDGNTSAPVVCKSSGHSSLDAAARDMITRASPFEPLPSELNLEEMDVTVPVAFRIEETQK